MLAPRLLRPTRRGDLTLLPTSSTAARSAPPRIPFPFPFPFPLPLHSSAAHIRRCLYHTTPRRLNVSQEELQRRLQTARPLVSHSSASRFENAGRSRNSKVFVAICVAAAFGFYFANSQTVPVTGRRRFNFLSDDFLDVLGSANADAVVRDIEEQGGRFLSERDPRVLTVNRVMKRLVPVSGMADLEWKVRVIDDERTANAFVTPGGNLFVFSGILRVCGNADALAAVLGHEIAHAVASHSAERMSSACAANLFSGSVFFLVGALPGLALFALWSISGGRFIQNYLFSLPMTRKMETEADYIGLMMMAEACYDPNEAIGYWRRMEHLHRHGGHEIPEMLSTHPSNENRIEKMTEWMPEALEKRRESDCRGTGAWADQFRETMLRRQLVRI